METISRTEFIKIMQRHDWELKGNFPNQQMVIKDYKINLYGFSFKTSIFGDIKEFAYTVNNATTLRILYLFSEDCNEYTRAAS